MPFVNHDLISASLPLVSAVLALPSTFLGSPICISVTGSLFLQQYQDSQLLIYKKGSETDTSILLTSSGRFLPSSRRAVASVPAALVRILELRPGVGVLMRGN